MPYSFFQIQQDKNLFLKEFLDIFRPFVAPYHLSAFAFVLFGLPISFLYSQFTFNNVFIIGLDTSHMLFHLFMFLTRLNLIKYATVKIEKPQVAI